MLYGIEELTKDGEGYVYWKGTHAEHYSFRDDEKEREAAHNLAKICRHLESLDIKVCSGSAVWFYSWYENMPKNAKYRDILIKRPGMYENETENTLALLYGDNAIYIKAGDVIKIEPLDTEFQTGRHSYHGMERSGYKLANVGQPEHCGICYGEYEGVVALLEEYSVNPEVLEGVTHD